MSSEDLIVLDTSSEECDPLDDSTPVEDACIKSLIDSSNNIWNRKTSKNIQAMLQELSVDVEMSSVFICRFCGHAFKRKYDCNQHEVAFHGGSVEDEFPCKHCNRVFVSQDFLDRHVWEAHTSEVSNPSLDENSPNSVDIPSQPRRKPKLLNSNDKENATSKPVAYHKGFVISYLGKPRFLFSNTLNKSNYRNQNNTIKRQEGNRVLSGENQNTSKIKHNAVMLNLEDLCRLCGSYDEHRVPIFRNTRYNFYNMIRDHFPQIKLSEDDILPTQICAKCETSLTTWYQFQRDCNAANLRFQSMLKMLVAEPDVKARLEKKRRVEADEYSGSSDCERMDDDAVEDSSDNDRRGPTEVELVNVQPDIPNYTPDSILPRAEIRRLKQRMRARIRLNRLKQRPSVCPVCDRTFNLPETLRRHMSTVHSDEKPYKCTMCTSSYNRNHYLTSHIKSVHLKETADRPAEPPHLCDYCGKALSSARSLQVHINCVHTKELSYECDTCHVTFYQKISLQNHLGRNQCTTLTRAKSELKLEEGFPKACEICGLEFKTLIFYTKHQMKHMTSLTCPVCSTVLDDANALKEHLELEHPEMTPFQCEVCGKRFKTKNFLQKHAIIHGGEKKFECEYCLTKFLKKKYLINHVRRHTGERPFVCSICERAFTQVSEMRIHKARHKLAKQF